MKQLIVAACIALTGTAAKAQTDSLPPRIDSLVLQADTLIIGKGEKRDTVNVGRVSIIINSKKHANGSNTQVWTEKGEKKKKKPANITTNWLVFDFGFSNYYDKTDYSNTGDVLVNRPGYPEFSSGDFKLKTGKSVNVNIWLFMQKYNLVKHHLHLKYGFGLELNNYRYKSDISYKEDGIIPYTNPPQATSSAFIFRDSIMFSKNKLAADYFTVPLMLNYTTNPNSEYKGLSISLGISAGYLYSQRNKQVSDERGKWTNKGEYNLERFKISYVGELGLGPIRLYGSYSPWSMYENSLDMRPYTLGLRFSSW